MFKDIANIIFIKVHIRKNSQESEQPKKIPECKRSSSMDSIHLDQVRPVDAIEKEPSRRKSLGKAIVDGIYACGKLFMSPLNFHNKLREESFGVTAPPKPILKEPSARKHICNSSALSKSFASEEEKEDFTGELREYQLRCRNAKNDEVEFWLIKMPSLSDK